MIDFNNASFMKLKPVPNSDFEAMVAPLFVSGEANPRHIPRNERRCGFYE